MKLIDVEGNKLTKSQIDYATAVAIGWEYRRGEWVKGDELKFSPACAFKPSTDWGHLGIAVDEISENYDIYLDGINLINTEHLPPYICCNMLIARNGYQKTLIVPEGEY